MSTGGGLSRARWLIPALTGLLLLAICITQYLFFRSSSEIDGYHHATGQVQLSNGQVQEVTHNLRIHNGRFYCMTRQGDSILETSGVVEHGFFGNFRLRVERGEVSSLTPEVDNSLVFNLMYAKNPGSTITLRKLNGCLYAEETQQVYCPET
ncbi:hypothetical protein WG219_00640 [Ectopseudomonas mendocina]|uniref:Uncharacterized protein n=1 Tax=Ectopseudomonas mendocina TaxID=300 RepID=A0ABZ2RLH2_ECTME